MAIWPALLIPVLVTSQLAALSSLQDFSGKCVHVYDGDTIGVLRDGREIRLRLEGIDCPEWDMDFGSQARRFTSELVLGKDVAVRFKEWDQYNRVVGRVTVDGKDLSLELIAAGLAWHYRRYSDDPALEAAEHRARDARIGLWSAPNPIPPWEFKAEQRPPTPEPGPYHGNIRSKVFHAPSCPDFECRNCSEVFQTWEEAVQAGYRPGPCFKR